MPRQDVPIARCNADRNSLAAEHPLRALRQGVPRAIHLRASGARRGGGALRRGVRRGGLDSALHPDGREPLRRWPSPGGSSHHRFQPSSAISRTSLPPMWPARLLVMASRRWRAAVDRVLRSTPALRTQVAHLRRDTPRVRRRRAGWETSATATAEQTARLHDFAAAPCLRSKRRRDETPARRCGSFRASALATSRPDSVRHLASSCGAVDSTSWPDFLPARRKLFWSWRPSRRWIPRYSRGRAHGLHRAFEPRATDLQLSPPLLPVGGDRVHGPHRLHRVWCVREAILSREWLGTAHASARWRVLARCHQHGHAIRRRRT